MAMKWFVILTIISLKCLLTQSIVPNCGTIRISCDLHDINCCTGPCCPFLHQYQSLLSLHPPSPNPVVITNSGPQPDPQPDPHPDPIPPSSSKPAPKVGEQCTSELPRDQQCDNGGIVGSTRCKYDGTADANGRLLGVCRINPLFLGCTTDIDCYKINNICNDGVCVDKFDNTLPVIATNNDKSPTNNGKSPPNNAPNDPPKNGFVPIVHNAKSVGGNLENQQIEMKGGTFERELNVPLSKQAQVLGIGVAIVIILCVILSFIRKLYRKNKDAIKGRRRDNRRPDMTDYGVDDADVDWSDETETTEEYPEMIRNGRRSVNHGFDVEALMNTPKEFSSSSEFDNGI